MTIDKLDFDFICELVHRRTGILLSPGKEYLAVTRLQSLVSEYGFGSIAGLVVQLRARPISPLEELVVEAMVTNETSFFRDLHPFESLRTDILPDVIRRNKDHRSINIWSAGCSSGQEVYSIAMVIREHFPELASWSIFMLATDVSSAVLERAREGLFGQMEVNRGLPAHLLLKYFKQDRVRWEIDDSIRRMVTFKKLNLIEPWRPLPPMDIVFLRNVLIYFAPPTKELVLERAKDVLRTGGHLLLGGSETPLTMDVGYERNPIGKTVWYRKKAPSRRDAGV